jgi:hypothetical protein
MSSGLVPMRGADSEYLRRSRAMLGKDAGQRRCQTVWLFNSIQARCLSSLLLQFVDTVVRFSYHVCIDVVMRPQSEYLRWNFSYNRMNRRNAWVAPSYCRLSYLRGQHRQIWFSVGYEMPTWCIRCAVKYHLSLINHPDLKRQPQQITR